MFLYEYMDSDELQDAKESALLDLEATLINKDFAILEMTHELNIHKAETKVLVENGTDDDLTVLYQREMDVYTESVKDLWEKFKKWIIKIWNIITGKQLTPEQRAAALKAEGKVELPFNPNKAIGAAEKAIPAIEGFPKYVKDDGSLNFPLLAATLGLSVASGAAGIGISALWRDLTRRTVVKVADLPTFLDKLVALKDKFINALKALSDKIKNTKAYQVAHNFIQSMASKISEWVDIIRSKIPFLKKKDKQNDQTDTSKDTKQQTDGEQNGDTGTPKGGSSADSDGTETGPHPKMNTDNNAWKQKTSDVKESVNDTFYEDGLLESFGFDDDDEIFFESPSGDDAKELMSLIDSL